MSRLGRLRRLCAALTHTELAAMLPANSRMSRPEATTYVLLYRQDELYAKVRSVVGFCEAQA